MGEFTCSSSKMVHDKYKCKITKIWLLLSHMSEQSWAVVEEESLTVANSVCLQF